MFGLKPGNVVIVNVVVHGWSEPVIRSFKRTRSLSCSIEGKAIYLEEGVKRTSSSTFVFFSRMLLCSDVRTL
jgi:hypothetical protein